MKKQNDSLPAFRLTIKNIAVSKLLYDNYFEQVRGRFDFDVEEAVSMLRIKPNLRGNHRFTLKKEESDHWFYCKQTVLAMAAIDVRQLPLSIGYCDVKFLNNEFVLKVLPSLFLQTTLPLYVPNKKSADFPQVVKSDDAEDPLFAEFWKFYPRKHGKGAARKSWKRLKKPAETLLLIEQALAWQCLSRQWKKEHGQYIPMPTTYLNQERWLDSPITL